MPEASDAAADMAVQAEDLRKEYPARAESLLVLDDVNLTVRHGESVAIMGPSGSGKSTLLHILGTLDRPTAGRISLAGKNPFELSEKSLARFRNETLGFVFQDHQLLPQCTALENVLIPTLAGNTRNAGLGGRRAAAGRARDLLARVGLAQRMDHRPADLSGGERQRVAIARAMINSPRILLCDEPTGNLDAEAGGRVAESFIELQHQEHVALIVVTHNALFASRFDRTFYLRSGRLSDENPLVDW
jgi:lipoprotein-releasing system ATP-binding protein